MLVERADHAGAQVRDRADVEHDLPVGELVDQAGVLGGADAVTQAVGAELLQRAANRGRPRDLAGVRHRGEP
jgi:hypothetical protein